MIAVIETGGKQYRVGVGDVVRVEKLAVEVGATVNLDKVLLISDASKTEVGTPYIKGKAVTAAVKAHGRDKKVYIFKMRRRQNSRTRNGHRQHYTELEIKAIGAAG
ncbi:MAG TPA: 50S ribosomal protein L21 [Acidiferrobacteraceae bacterium]|nr:50S ribosomal protein L21 [Acidiferrobacteraceae bacterium]HEX19893.1 50S ribosomal protein L21 [Acidiferrobacteraceae bacterium]